MRSCKIFPALSFCFLLLCGISAQAQTGSLERAISIHAENKSLEETLALIENAGGCRFAYNTALIPLDSLITYHAANKPLRNILDDLFRGNLTYAERGRFIILQSAPKKSAAPKEVKMRFTVAGQVTNGKTHAPLAEATVYVADNLKSSVTNEAGRFQLDLAQWMQTQTLFISKAGFRDTALVISPAASVELEIALSPDIPVAVEIADTLIEATASDSSAETVEQLPFVRFLTNIKQRINALNIKDGFNRPVQLSVVPMIGTNRKLSGSVSNNFSFNVFAGYNGGVKGAEIGGLVNIIRDDMTGFQLAGLSNIVGRQTRGAQIGGIFNFNMGDTKGFQLGGITNITLKTTTGFQLGGIGNYSDKFNGFQLGGIFNVVRKEMRGFQLAGIVNYAGIMRGAQFGLINVADSAAGTPIGLLSFVRKGYHHADVYYDETNYANVSFKTGVQHFYNIISAGWSWSDTSDLWRVGYGLGSEFTMGKKKRGFTNMDLSVFYINKGKDFITDLNILSSFNLDFGFRFHKYFGVYLGPGVKVYNSQYLNPETGKSGLDIAYHPVFENVKNGQLNQVWVGFRGGARF